MNCEICRKPAEPNTGCWVTTDKRGNVESMVHDDCKQGQALDEFRATGMLTSSLCLTAQMRAYDGEAKWQPVVDACNRIKAAVKYFERAAWFGGVEPEIKEQRYEGPRLMFPRVDKSIQSMLLPVRGLSGRYGKIEMLVYAMAGRAMVTLTRGDASITVITADNEQTDRMGWQGLSATEGEAVALLLEAGANWEKFDLKEDVKVGLGGL